MEDMEIDAENNISAGEGVDIPEDITQSILLRLPVKSLARFRCVSKPWLFLISSYEFSKAHLKFSKKKNEFINQKLILGSKYPPVNLYTCPIQSITEGSNLGVDQVYPPTNDSNLLLDRIGSNNCPFAGKNTGMWLVGSCNGLVCAHFEPDVIILWNPTTRESKRLPNSDTNRIRHICFTFAFGYDEVHDDYKVVELSWFDPMLDDETEIGVKVYSLRNNSWKSLSNWPGGFLFDGMGKFLNGAVHWLVGNYNSRDERVIVSHHLATPDTFTEFHGLPVDLVGNFSQYDDEDDELEDDDGAVELDILEGRLALYYKHDTHIDVWVMQEYGASKPWAKVVKIPFLLDFEDHSEFVKPRPLFFFVDGKVLINYGESLMMYDLNNPESHEFSGTTLVETTMYFESLISPSLEDKVILGRSLPSEISCGVSKIK